MMTSFVENIPTIIKTVVKYNPKHILDIGSGFGKYGLLMREAFLSIKSEQGDLCPDYWSVDIDCMDEAKYFIGNPSLKAIYNHVIMADARLMNYRQCDYDLITLIDVAEHWSRVEYMDFVQKIKNQMPECKILVSTPKEVFMYKDRHYDSEVHHTQFAPDDFRDCIENVSTDLSYIYVI